MRKAVFFGVIALMAIMLSGCGVQIKQEGNKIFTDADKDMVYKFANTALEKEQYEVKERSREDGMIYSVPLADNPIFAEIKDSPKLNVSIKERAEQGDVVVELQALISGDVDEKKSTEVARRAVDRMIEELNKYGKFVASAEGTATVASSDKDSFLNYLETALKEKGYTVARTETGVSVVGAASDSEYNDALKGQADITVQGNQLNVSVKASIEGNYDKAGNEQKVKQAVSDLTAVVDAYPVVEQNVQQSYSFVSQKTAFAWAKTALDTLGYMIESSDETAFTMSTKKDAYAISVGISDAGDNKMVVTVTARGEGGDKAALQSGAETILSAIKNELALYQVEKSDSKMFSDVPMDKAYGYAKAALVGTGYTVVKDAKGQYIVVGSKTAKPVVAVCMVNSMGEQGIAIEATAYVNGNKVPQQDAMDMAAAEVAKIIKYLGKYDKVISAK